MSDRHIVELIRRVVPNCRATFVGDRCVEFHFTNESDPYYGLLRRLDQETQRQMVRLAGELKHLRLLDLRKCRLYDMPTLELPHLTHLILGSNYLGRMPNWIKEMPITYLDMGVNNLTKLPEWISDMPLETLKLHKNQLSTVPKPHPGIKAFNLYFNPMSLPEWVWELPDLEYFSFGLTATRLPESISKASKLRWLCLVANNLETLPDGFSKLSSLVGTRLAKNKLKTLPKDIGELQNLEQITLYGNQLDSLPPSFFSLPLKKLNLAHNRFNSQLRLELGCRFRHLDYFEI